MVSNGDTVGGTEAADVGGNLLLRFGCRLGLWLMMANEGLKESKDEGAGGLCVCLWLVLGPVEFLGVGWVIV